MRFMSSLELLVCECYCGHSTTVGMPSRRQSTVVIQYVMYVMYVIEGFK